METLSLKLALQCVVGILTLLLPGILLSYIFFSKTAIDIIERVAIGFGLSIVIISSVTLILGLIGIKVTLTSLVIEITLITLAALSAIILKGLIHGKT